MKRKKSTILIVDDTSANVFVLEQILQKSDRRILSTSNGKEALKIIMNEEVDLVMLDVQMPEMDGFEVAQILKSGKRTGDIPIIFVSAEKKEHHFMMKGFAEGGVDYLYKPLDPEITEAKVAVMLQLQIQKKELIEKNQTLEKYALLINNSADMICIVNPRTMKFEEMNNAVNTILEYSMEEIKGSPVKLYVPEEDWHYMKELTRSHREKFYFETRAYTRKRNIRWLHWNIVSRKGLWFANIRDITEIKEVEEIRNYLAAVVQQSEDAIYLHNADGKIISWNNGAEKIYGFREEEAMRMKIWNIIPKHLHQEAQQVINNLLSGKHIQSLETKRITKFGKMLDVLFSASVISDTAGNVKSIAITERDITQRKEYEDQLKRQTIELKTVNKELESFSYSVSHDLRAPLRAIGGFARMLEKRAGDQLDAEGKRLLNIIGKNVTNMGQLIDDLLNFSRIGRAPLNVSEIDLNEVVSDTINMLTQEDPAVAGRIQVDTLPPAACDYSMMKHVFQNLLSNAIKYSSRQKQPKVQVGHEESEEGTVYYVKDNGAGFDMQYADKLFEVFQRLHDAEEFEGTGIGLALVQRIILRHGGKVWAESEPEKGATFFFTIPAQHAVIKANNNRI